MVEESKGMVEESRGWYRYFHMRLQQQILFNMHIYLSGDTDIKRKNTYMTNRNSKNASKCPCRQHHFIHPVGKKKLDDGWPESEEEYSEICN